MFRFVQSSFAGAAFLSVCGAAFFSYRLSDCGGAGRGDLLVPFVAPHVLIVSVILVIVERSSFSWSSVLLVLAPHSAWFAAFSFFFLVSLAVQCR